MDEIEKLDQHTGGKYKERIVGKNLLVSAPREYWDMAIIKELGVSITEWESYSMEHRARYVAHQYLKSMLDVIEQHYKEQDDEFEKRGKGKS